MSVRNSAYQPGCSTAVDLDAAWHRMVSRSRSVYLNLEDRAHFADSHTLRGHNGVDRLCPCGVGVEEERAINDPHPHDRPFNTLGLLQGVGLTSKRPLLFPASF